MKYEVFPYGEGFGYNIYSDAGSVVVSQNFNPKEPGFVYMSEAVAAEMAQMDMLGIVGSSVEVSLSEEQRTPETQKSPSSSIGHVDFLMRLSPAERKDFNRMVVQVEIDYTEAVKSGSIPEALEDTYDFLNMFKKASYIDLTFEPTIQGVTWIGTNFLGMTAERVAEILKP